MRKGRLSDAKQGRLMEHFVAGTTARCAAALVGVNRKTAAYYFHRLREIICYHLELEADRVVGGEIEVDESCFGGRRKGKRGRGAAGKAPVFGLLKRGGRVYAKIIPDARSDTLIPIIGRKVVPDSMVYSDCWEADNVLDVSDFKHLRINHSKLFADDRNHINGIENFWNQAKRHMRKFNGVPKAHFPLFLKECEGRFNNAKPKAQLRMIKQWLKEYLSELSGTAPSRIQRKSRRDHSEADFTRPGSAPDIGGIIARDRLPSDNRTSNAQLAKFTTCTPAYERRAVLAASLAQCQPCNRDPTFESPE